MFDISFHNLGVAIVAPSGYAPDETAYARAIDKLQTFGCVVQNYYQAHDKFERFGGTDDARLCQLEAAIENPEVHVVLCMRGGYGISRLLPSLDFAKMAASGKIFIGHSDFTPVHMGLLKAGAISFAGPMALPDFATGDDNAFTMRHFRQCLCNPEHTISVLAGGNPELNVSGVLWGGNLTMLTHLIGTQYLPHVEGGILFVEDIAEHPYRIERMMLQLLYSGVLARQKAVVLGNFSDYRLSPYDNGYDFEAMLAYLRATLPIPVLSGLPFGHVRDKATLAVGAKAHLISDGDSWELTMRGYPYLDGSHRNTSL